VPDFALPDYLINLTERNGNFSREYLLTTTPNDPLYWLQWAFNDKELAKLYFPEAWDITKGSSDIVIAVLDTGFDVVHPDMAGKNTGNGYDFVDNDFGIQDSHGHGTLVSGIEAANSYNGIGVVGACWNCKILPIRVCNDNDQDPYQCSHSRVVAGIHWAVDHGAKIINMSLAGSTTFFGSIVWQDAIDYAYEKDVVLVAAAGNHSENLDIPYTSYPAQANHVIAVGAINKNNQRCDNSADSCNWGGENAGSGYGYRLDVMAPGSLDIVSTDISGTAGFVSGDYYANMGGTSAATPFVSGLVGLMYSINPTLKPDKVIQILHDSSYNIGPIEHPDRYYGYGRINAYGAVVLTPLLTPK